ncbi:MAG TPA: response regulator [Longimicrobiaceae bacterium]|nr:response regulator [Longimicrobiaceae bacterium]
MSAPAPAVLLVEDNDAIRTAFTILLEDSGFRVASAARGADALRLAGESRPDVVVLDLGLPDMGGLDVARALTAPGGTRIPIVALTGRALDSERAEALAAGCAAFLTKPVDTHELLRVIGSFAGID